MLCCLYSPPYKHCNQVFLPKLFRFTRYLTYNCHFGECNFTKQLVSAYARYGWLNKIDFTFTTRIPYIKQVNMNIVKL